MKKALIVLLIFAITPSQAQGAEEGTCDVPVKRRDPDVPLQPSDLPPPRYLENWENSTLSLSSSGSNNDNSKLSLSQIQFNQSNHLVPVSVLTQLIPTETVRRIRQLLQDVQLDRDPDTVDAMPTYELFLFSPGLGQMPAKHDNNPTRQRLRQDILQVLQPILQERLTPFVNQYFCHAKKKQCFPCYSLIRRYQEVDRLSHAVHHDGHAYVTAVISLSDYDADYTGGLYVDDQEKRFLRLNAGDAVLHQFQLRHGVNVLSGSRYSLIVWYLDSSSESCEEQNSFDWFQECNDNPVCWHLQSTVDQPGLTPEEQATRVAGLLERAAHQGVGAAAMKLGRAYAHWIPSPHAANFTKARAYFTMAAEDAKDPEGYYGLAHLDLLDQAPLSKVVQHLEAGAMLGHAYSMFNLGIAHLFGYNGVVDQGLAAQWFEQSGLPEGLVMAASHEESMGNKSRHDFLMKKALSLGYNQKWRKMVREQVGSGGTNGIDLNLPWPLMQGQQRPPQF